MLDTADGTNTIRAAESQHIVQCEAPGYATYEAIVQHEPPGSGRQLILLEPESRIEGRLKREQVASVQLAQQPHAIPQADRSEPDHGIGWEWFGRHRFDLPQFSGRERSAEIDDQGNFEFEGLVRGTYRLVITRGDGSLVLFEQLVVGTGSTTSLGFIDLEASSTLMGRVRVAAGRSPAGIALELDRGLTAGGAVPARSLTDANGNFAFEGVPVGTHRLGIAAPWSEYGGLRPLLVDVSANETQHVEWDLAPFGPRTVCISVDERGAPAAGVQLASADWDRRRHLGYADDVGQLCAELRPGHDTHVLALTEDLEPLGVLALGDGVAAPFESRASFTLACGSLLLRFDETLPWSADDRVELRLERADWPLSPLHFSLRQQPAGPQRGPALGDRNVLFPRIAAGEWSLTLHVHHRVSPQQEHSYVAHATVRVEESQRALCDVRFH